MDTKHTLLAAAIALVGSALAVAPGAQAADGTISFTGKVLNSTCSVSNASGGIVAVTLPTVQASALTSAAPTAGQIPFELSLTGCPTSPSGVVVAADFSGSTNIDTATGALMNGTGLSYSNVQVQMTDGKGAPINLGKNAAPVSATIDGSGAATLGYRAQYYKPSTITTVTPGAVNTSVAFTLTYN